MIPNFRSSSPPNKSFHSLFQGILLFLIFSSISPYMVATKVHPMGGTKRNIAIRDGPHSKASAEMEGIARKKLRKLPHVFSKVLELPFRSDADVAIEEGPDFFQFFAKIKVDANVVVGNVRAHAVEIHPGVVKVVVRNDNRGGVELSLDKLEIDTWRYRLPSSTLPELATAEFVDRELVVTVPKGGGSRRGFVDGGDRSWRGGSGRRLVLVQ